MPIYEYYCKKCGNKIEIFKSINDDNPEICSKCKYILTKQISKTSFKLKGSCWANDGYKK